MNDTVIVAIIGAVAAALVSIFQKVSDMPAAKAQAEAIDTDASLRLSQGWQQYANQIKADNDTLREEIETLRGEFEQSKRDCSERIAKLEQELASQRRVKPKSRYQH